jgi:hypothetical protein
MHLILLLLTILGLLTSAAAHLSTFYTDRFVEHLGLLHISMFFICVPACAFTPPTERLKPSWNDITRHAPGWMGHVVIFCFLYAMANFGVLLFLTREGSPGVQDGKYVLMHGRQVVQPLTEEEFHVRNRYSMRGMSGLWMMFYAAGMTVACSTVRQRRAERAARLTSAAPPPWTHVQSSGARSYTLHPRPLLLRWARQNPPVTIVGVVIVAAAVAGLLLLLLV